MPYKEIIEDRYKEDTTLKEKVSEVTKASFFPAPKAGPKLKINVNALMSMKSKSEASIVTKPRLFSNRGPRNSPKEALNNVPRSAEGRLKDDEKAKVFSSYRVLPTLGKKEAGLPRLKSRQQAKELPSSNNFSASMQRKTYKFQTLKPRLHDEDEMRQSADQEMRSTKGKFPKELFSMVSKKKFVI